MYQNSVRPQQFYKKHFKIKVQKMNRLGTHKYPFIFNQDTSSEHRCGILVGGGGVVLKKLQ